MVFFGKITQKYESVFTFKTKICSTNLNTSDMKKIILRNGLLGASIIVPIMLISIILHQRYPEKVEWSMFVGFTGMFMAFIFVFVGTKQFRDKIKMGQLAFGEGLKIGMLIALLISTIYVVVWMFEYNFFFPNFGNEYADYIIKNAEPEKLAEVTKDANFIKEIYKNQLYIFFYTYIEILPIGIVFALISALILKRKVQA